MRLLWARSAELIRSHAAIFAVLAIWAFAPLVGLLVYVGQHGGVLTGANGADAFDQMAYLAWIRDEGSHVVASNLWQVGPTPHDYLHPMHVISGLLWRLGVSIQVAYLVWKPVAVLVLFLGFAAYVRRLLPHGRRQQAAALVLALFYLCPLLPVASWLGHPLSLSHRYQLVLVADDAYSAVTLWGFDHTAIAIGLMPVFLIAVEKLLSGRARGSAPARGVTAVAAVAGLLVSWLRPWQGATLLAIMAGLLLLRAPRRRYGVLIVPALATLLPLTYGIVLSRWDASWHFFQLQTTQSGRPPAWTLLVAFGPLALLAALGVRRPRADADWMLLLWPAAAAAVYLLIPEFPPHALTGLPLPLAVLAVRGWQRAGRRTRVPWRVAAPAAIVALAFFTVPAALDHAKGPRDDLRETLTGTLDRQLLRLTPDQADALRYLDHARRPGGVLAPLFLSMSVPGFTGRAVYAGHQQWQPRANRELAGTFYDGSLEDPTGGVRRAILAQAKVAFVIVDCGATAKLTRDVARLARSVRRFGCVTVYETR